MVNLNPFEERTIARLDRERQTAAAAADRAERPGSTPRQRQRGILSLHAGDAGWPRSEKPQPPIPAPDDLRQPPPTSSRDDVPATSDATKPSCWVHPE
jgi:hypothetical protein